MPKTKTAENTATNGKKQRSKEDVIQTIQSLLAQKEWRPSIRNQIVMPSIRRGEAP